MNSDLISLVGTVAFIIYCFVFIIIYKSYVEKDIDKIYDKYNIKYRGRGLKIFQIKWRIVKEDMENYNKV